MQGIGFVRIFGHVGWKNRGLVHCKADSSRFRSVDTPMDALGLETANGMGGKILVAGAGVGGFCLQGLATDSYA